MNQPTVIITPADRAPYRYVNVQIWAEALDRYVAFTFQVVGNDTHEARALRWLADGNLRYWLRATPETIGEGHKMVTDIMRDAATYGNCD